MEQNLNWREVFPHDEVWKNQRRMLEMAEQHRRMVAEVLTGEGKTAGGYSILKALQQNGAKGAFIYAAPNKTLVRQVKKLHPEVEIIYGRNEYPCPYYQERGRDINADEAPCSLINCPPPTTEEGVELGPCPYYAAKERVEQGDIVACTMSYFLVTKVFQDWPERIAGLILDEVHQIAKVARLLFGYDITDYNLGRLIDFLADIDEKKAGQLREFRDLMIKIARLKPARKPSLLEPDEIEKLVDKLQDIHLEGVRNEIINRLRRREIDPVELVDELKLFEILERDLLKYINSFHFALEEEGRNPLAYVFAFYQKEISGRKKVKYKLCIRNHYVAGLIRYALRDAQRVLGYSATVGDPEIFGVETGIGFPFQSFPPAFPADNARIYLPQDTPNLAYSKRGPDDPQRGLDMIANAASNFIREDLRSLIVVQSEKQRQDFLERAQNYELEAVSYGNGASAKEAAVAFRDGQGEVLVGTSANYSHGIDLPRKTAPVIFFLKPGYPPPQDPAAQFEQRRFGREKWKVWNWRVIIEALQVRGRNIRSKDDIGVAFFISQQFARLFPGGLPEWLKSSWNTGQPMEDQVKEATQFLKYY